MPNGVRPPASNRAQTIAFAILTETSSSTNASPVYDVDGKFTGWDTNYGDGTSFRHGFAGRTEVDAGADKGVIGWTRLVGGTRALGFARGPESGDHFVWGLPATNRPTGGTALFQLIGVTHPTMRDESVAAGSFTGQLSIAFSSLRMGIDATVAIGGVSIPIVSEGGLIAPSMGISSGTINLTNGGPACITGGCRFIYNGFLAGPGATNYGLAYTIRDNAPNTFKFVDGVAVFGNPGPVPGAGGNFSTAYRGVTVQSGFAQPTTTYEGLTTIGLAREVGQVGETDGVMRNPSDAVTVAGAYTPQLTEISVNLGVGRTTRGIGTAKNADTGGLGGSIGWTRWTDGTLNMLGDDRTLTGSTSIHMVYGGFPSGTLPTGKASYQLAGGTRPTRADGLGTPGTIKGELAIDFATSKVGWDVLIAIADDRFNFVSSGGLANPSVALTRSSGSAIFTGEGLVHSERGRCGGCTGSVNGLVTGPGGRYAGFAYDVGTFDYGAIHGVAVFDKVGP